MKGENAIDWLISLHDEAYRRWLSHDPPRIIEAERTLRFIEEAQRERSKLVGCRNERDHGEAVRTAVGARAGR